MLKAPWQKSHLAEEPCGALSEAMTSIPIRKVHLVFNADNVDDSMTLFLLSFVFAQDPAHPGLGQPPKSGS